MFFLLPPGVFLHFAMALDGLFQLLIAELDGPSQLVVICLHVVV